MTTKERTASTFDISYAVTLRHACQPSRPPNLSPTQVVEVCLTCLDSIRCVANVSKHGQVRNVRKYYDTHHIISL